MTSQAYGSAIQRVVGRRIDRVIIRRSSRGVSPRCQVILFLDDGSACEIFGNDVDVARNLGRAEQWRERLHRDEDYDVVIDTTGGEL